MKKKKDKYITTLEIPQSLESRGVRPPENVVLVQNICKAKYLEKSYISDLKFSIL